MGEAPGLSLPLVPPPPQTTPLSRLLGGVLKTGEGVRVGVGEELGVARHGVARPHGRRAAEDGAPGYRLPVLGENLLYLGVVPLPSEAHSPQTLDSTRARELLRKKTLPVGHAPTTTPRPRPSTPQPTVTLERARPLPLAALVSLSLVAAVVLLFFLCSFQRRGVKFVHMGRIEYRGLVLIISLTESFVIFSMKDVI